MDPDRHQTSPYLLMLCGSFSFTIMAEFAYALTRECDWQTVAVFRGGLVAAFAAVVAWAGGTKLVFLRPWRLWVRSVAGSCSMVCTFYAFARLPAADVITLANTFPMWVAVLAWPLYGERPGTKLIGALSVGILGVILVEQPHLEAGNLGVYMALAAAAFTAVAMLGLHSLGGIDPRAVVVHFSSVASVFCLTAFLVGPRVHPIAEIADTGIVLMLLGLGVTATVGQMFLTLAFGKGSPAKVAVVGLTQIVFAFVCDVWLWGREVNAAAVVGTLLVVAPTAWLITRSRSHGEK